MHVLQTASPAFTFVMALIAFSSITYALVRPMVMLERHSANYVPQTAFPALTFVLTFIAFSFIVLIDVCQPW